jgi:NADH-quinone oxidoreductase subunit C
VSSDRALDQLTSRGLILSAREDGGVLQLEVEARCVRDALLVLRSEGRFDFMLFMTAIDRPAENRIEVVYRLFSYETKASAVVRVKLERMSAAVDTVSDVYRTAEWHEREAAEMFGIAFTNHPDPRKLLLPDDMEGYPLRKDFVHENLKPLPEVP